MDDEISLDSSSQVIFFKKKDCVDFFITKSKHCTHSSGDGESCSKSRCKIASASIIFSLACVADSYRAKMDTSVDDAFCAHASKIIDRCGPTEDRMRTVSGCKSNNVSRSEWEFVFEKEGIAKKNKVYSTNLVANNLSYLSTHDHERVRLARKASKALGMHSTSDFNVATRVGLMHDDEVSTEDAALAEKTFGPNIGGLKGKTTRFKPFPM